MAKIQLLGMNFFAKGKWMRLFGWRKEVGKDLS